ncbi:class II aldolase/adducin family protein [Nocardioides sp. DS6]|uniref:Class II aldolase/adducin family protein n=1 Tax=Nocardioides eburneus TaxID=3231482 RepID=A0ABV3SXP2_9ACTN
MTPGNANSPDRGEAAPGAATGSGVASDELNALRDDLVAANRILVRQGVLDAFGHVSSRVAPGMDRFLLSGNLAPGSVTASDLLVHDLEATTSAERSLYLERFIHAEIYRRRPDVMAIVHSHSASVIPLGVTSTPLLPIIHMAGFLPTSGTAVFEISDHAGDASDLLITSSSLGASLAEALGDDAVILMRGHGSVAVGASLPEAVYRAVYTEVNARTQLQALALGTPRYLSSGEASTAARSVGGQTARAWNVWREEARPTTAE